MVIKSFLLIRIRRFCFCFQPRSNDETQGEVLGTMDSVLVSIETVVLRQWERSKQKFGFIKRVDKGWISTVKDLESWRFERYGSSIGKPMTFRYFVKTHSINCND